MNTNNYSEEQRLIDTVDALVKKDDQIANLLNENFNVFSILRGEGDEQRLHSAFIAELLNVNGTHNQKNRFLCLFVESAINEVNKDVKFNLGENIETMQEKSIANGRIDIYIEGTEGIIAIENKIWAGDQWKQLKRYKEHLLTLNKDHRLLYLTLYGRDASEASTGGTEEQGGLKEGEDYQAISYETHIIQWLEKCQKEVARFPVIRETIAQYILLINKLTGKLRSQQMNKEIKELIVKNYRAAHNIASNIDGAVIEGTESLLKTITEKVTTALPADNWEISLDADLTQKWKGLSIRHKQWSQKEGAESIVVKLEGQSVIYKNGTIYGVVANKKYWDREDVNNKLRNIIEIQELRRPPTTAWPFFEYILNLGASEQREKLFNNDEQEKLAHKIADKLINLSKACESKLTNIKMNAGN